MPRLCKLSILVISILVLNLVVSSQSFAVSGLTVSPLRSEFEISPGTSQDGFLTIKNQTDRPMKVIVSAEEFSVINQQYDYAFTVESNVAKWVTINQPTLVLAPGETKNASYSVGVPLASEPGGRYISLFASTDTEPQNQSVSSRQRIASLLYITVTGDVTRSGHLVSLTSPWVVSDIGEWSVALQNTGTTHFRSRYSVSVQDLFGNSVATDTSGSALILPGTVRLVSDKLPQPQIPGIYKNIFNVGLGDTPAVTKTRVLLYMPIWATILALLMVTTTIYWIVYKQKHKQQKKN